jgi:phage FluMu protein Com
LNCSHCGHQYGANGSDYHHRKCPKCQGGAPGESISGLV